MKFCDKTLDAIIALANGVDGAHTMSIHNAEGFKPKGIEQNCDTGIVANEWVNQTGSGGFSGDEFSGTVTWLLGKHYVVMSYAT